MSQGPLSIKWRVKQSRERQRQAGLKRVEVGVPADQVDMVKAYAAHLREGSHAEAIGEVRKLVAKAYQKFRARYLDNISVNPNTADFADAAVIAAALMHRGNADAFRLGKQIQSLDK